MPDPLAASVAMSTRASPVTIEPLRDLVLVELLVPGAPGPGQLQVVRPDALVRPARIVACGPEVRDLRPAMVALVNTGVGVAIDGYLLVPEPTIVGTL